MNIEEMSEQEKSITLARLCGWQVSEHESQFTNGGLFALVQEAHDKWAWVADVNIDENGFNLYDPVNMPLAWRVLNWAYANFTDTNIRGFWCGNQIELREFILYSEFETMPPSDAQRAWLDKILGLAIKAGMVAND